MADHSARIFFVQSANETNSSTFLPSRASLMACRVCLFGMRIGKGSPSFSLTWVRNSVMASLEVRPIFLSTASASRLSAGSTRARMVSDLPMCIVLTSHNVAHMGYEDKVQYLGAPAKGTSRDNRLRHRAVNRIRLAGLNTPARAGLRRLHSRCNQLRQKDCRGMTCHARGAFVRCRCFNRDERARLRFRRFRVMRLA